MWGNSVRASARARITLTAATAAAVVAGVVTPLFVTGGGAGAVAAPVSPVLQRPANGVTADPLPTTQIDGVVWAQAVVGNTVYAGGNFANARPAGAAAGTQLTPRKNMLSFDITTGVLNTAFNPSFNAQVKAIAVSPDGSRIYVGGQFTTAGTVTRNRIAAFSTATGQLITSFAPSVNATVNAITVTNNAVYVGGLFSQSGGVARNHLAAFDPTTGALLAWAPSADNTVSALQVTPDGSLVIAGGAFKTINGASAYGLGALDSVTGTLAPWAANNVVRDAGSTSAITSLSTDGTAIYATGYVFGSDGNFEGVLSADPDSGAVRWLADCHGDSYDSFGVNGLVYVASHEHHCANIGGFPDTNPRTIWNRATVFTQNATGTVRTNLEAGGHYQNFAGYPSPSLINWLPFLQAGTFTGQSQAAWSVTGNTQYVVEGGEFPKVNSVDQQGLVRFAVPSIAPRKNGPELTGTAFTATATSPSTTSAKLSWVANWDRDDYTLSYSVYRQDRGTTPVYTTTSTNSYWNRPTLGFTDNSLQPGTTYNYQVVATDPDGNSVSTAWVPVTTSGTATNQQPVPAFTATPTNLSVAFDASASSDPDGTVTSYAWDFGDGTTAAASASAQTTHPYTSPGTYQVTLTITDNGGQSASLTKAVTVSSAPVAGAADTFTRTTTSGWGTADTGGPWTASKPAQFSVNGSQGVITLAAGNDVNATLGGVSVSDLTMAADVSVDSAPTGGGTSVTFQARKSSTSSYRVGLRLLATGAVHLVWTKISAGVQGKVTEINISGLTYSVGDTLRLKITVSGTGPATLSGKVWKLGTSEPATAQLTGTDTDTNLQGAGSIAIQSSLSSTATVSPVHVMIDNLSVTSP